MKDLEENIKDILFDLVTTLKIHTLIDGNMILDVEYDESVNKIINLFESYKDKS